jgi:AraC family transcriptional activator of pobA
MAYNRRKIVEEMEALVSSTPSIQLSQIVCILGLNRHTIETAIRSSKQMSFREYRRGELLNKAQVMLKDSNMSVKEIASSLGYGSLSSFCRFVHRYTGRSPCQVRDERAEAWE